MAATSSDESETQHDAQSEVRRRVLRATLMLIFAQVFWGLSFPITKHWQEGTVDCPGGPAVSTLTLLGLRTLLALAVFAVFQPRLFVLPTTRELGIGMLLGSLNFLGSFYQTLGLASTTPALSGFFTSLASAWVPVLGFVLFRLSVARATLAGLGLGIAGAAFLQIDPNGGWAFGKGEAHTLLGSVIFALVILLLDRFGQGIQSSHLTIGFVTMNGLPAILALPFYTAASGGVANWFNWLTEQRTNLPLILDVVLLAVLCTSLAFYWMTTYQPRIGASRAALLYLLEPVLAALFSIAWGFDVFTPRLIAGGALILGGNLLVELAARWQNAVARSRANSTGPTDSASGPANT